MARPEEIQEAIAKTFRLPAALVEQLTAAAGLRSRSLSDAVREILSENVKEFFSKCRAARESELNEPIEQLRKHKKLWLLFERFKDQPEWPIPQAVMQDPVRLELLSCALRAHQALLELESQYDHLFNEIPRSVATLKKLIASVPDKLKKVLLGLEGCIEAGNLRVVRDGEGFDFVLRADFAAAFADNRSNDEAGVTRLRSLVKHGSLRPAGSSDSEVHYRWTKVVAE